MSAHPPLSPTVLHYVGYDDDRGGIVSVVRTLAAAGAFACVLGLNRGAVQRREPVLPVAEFFPIAGETFSLTTLWRARKVVTEARRWLRAGPTRVFHGHSRAGLLVALWLALAGERRVVASVHCYGRRRWLYRRASGVLGARLFWLSPAMRAWYGVPGEGWAQCIPGCVVPTGGVARERGDKLRLGGVGALVRWKGWHHVLVALAALPAELRVRFFFEHVGGEDDSIDSRAYAGGLRAQTTALGLDANVRWAGAEPSAVRLLREIDALVIASDHEPFSVAMLEALHAGVPVLAADSGGARDVIAPPANGWLFRSGDARDLSRAIARVAEEIPPGGAPCARIARESLRRFRAEEVAAQWARVYASLLEAEAHT
jgi:glycosyltransferase involved in cell wall biosynthesis